MRILIIGFIAFISWSAFSTYIYVCEIKGFCYEPKNVTIATENATDSTNIPIIAKTAEEPKNMTSYFEFDKSEFKPTTDSKRQINEFSVFLEQNIKAWLIIAGHTDAIGSKEYNKALGHRRAQTMVDYCVKNGLSANKIIVLSKGEEEPIDNNNSNSGRANNRRTEITIKK